MHSLFADFWKGRMMFFQIVMDTTAGNGRKTGEKGYDFLLIGMKFVQTYVPAFLEKFFRTQMLKMPDAITRDAKTLRRPCYVKTSRTAIMNIIP